MPGGEGRKNGELVFGGYKVSAGEDETVLELDGGHGCTRMGIHLIPLNRTFKNATMENFCLMYILQLKDKTK